MNVIKQTHEIIGMSLHPLKTIERVARTCYQSHDKAGPGTDHKMAEMLVANNHDAMLEFANMTVLFITDRGVSHELVRHRMASYAQESTRYCSYVKQVTFIEPHWWKAGGFKKQVNWLDFCETSEASYTRALTEGWSAQDARALLNHSLKTEIVVSANLREWRHILKLRCSSKAHPQMRALMLPLLEDVQEKIPILFEDILEKN